MENRSLALNFIEDAGAPALFPPSARVYARLCPSEETLHYVTKDCMTAQELDLEVNRLIAELEEVRRQGRSKFAYARVAV